MKKSQNVSGKDIAKTAAFLSLFFGALFALPLLQIGTTAKWILVLVLAILITAIWAYSMTEKPNNNGKEH